MQKNYSSKIAEEKINKTYGIRKILKQVIKNEFKNAEVDDLKYENFDSFQVVAGKSTNLSGVEKFNYLRCFLEGNALHAIAGFSLTNDNYKEALELLQNKYGNRTLYSK